MRREITDVFLRNLEPPAAGRTEIWDTRVTGLALRLTASGAATWSVRARTAAGKRVRPSLGNWPNLGIAAARRLARAEIVNIEAGHDPVEEARTAAAERQATLAQPTVADRLGEWQEARAGRWAPGYALSVDQTVKREVVPHLGALPLRETTRAAWMQLLAAKHRQSPSAGANLYRITAAFLGHAEAVGWIDQPLLPRKGASIVAPAVKSRARVLTDAEISKIWAAADGMSPKVRCFVHLLIMTGARRQEAADIATGEVDVERGLWAIPAARTKNHTALTVPLHALLLPDLHAVWPEHRERAGAGWRLLGAIRGSGLRGFSKVKTQLDAKSGVREWHVHDLRRSARTGMARLGVTRDHAEAAIGHVSGRSSLERVYDRHRYEAEILAALARWQAHVASLVVTDAPLAEVVPLRKQA